MKSGGERVRDEHWLQGWKYDDCYEDMFEIIDKRCLLISKPNGEIEWIRSAYLYQSMNRTVSKEQVWDIASYGFLE